MGNFWLVEEDEIATTALWANHIKIWIIEYATLNAILKFKTILIVTTKRQV